MLFVKPCYLRSKLKREAVHEARDSKYNQLQDEEEPFLDVLERVSTDPGKCSDHRFAEKLPPDSCDCWPVVEPSPHHWDAGW